MDSPIIINWMSPLIFLGMLGVMSYFLSHFSMKFLFANRIAPEGLSRSSASNLGLYRLPMSHTKDTSLKRLKITKTHKKQTDKQP